MPPRNRPRTGFRFDPRTGRYRNARTGRMVGQAEIRRAAELVIGKSARRVEGLSSQLRSGSISVEEFEIGMRVEIKLSQLQSRIAAKGGRQAMTQADYGLAGQRIRTEYQYLTGFSDQIAAGSIPLDGRFTRRAISYALGGRAAYSETERQEQITHGFLFESNVLQPGESCEGCLAASAAGVVPIGSLTPIGSRDCLHNCRCRIEYQRTA